MLSKLKMIQSRISMGVYYLTVTVRRAHLNQEIRRASSALFCKRKELSLRNYCKDVALRPPDRDLLLHKLTSAVDAAELLDIIGSHHSIMNNKHVLQALRSLFEHQKSKYSGISSQEILRSPEFVSLCKRLKSSARSIELNETIEALKIVSYFGVPASSVISQVLLQLVRHNVNDLSLQHILFVDFLLRRMERGPLVDALQIALPIVFETHLATKLDRNNVRQISEMLVYATRKSVSDDSVELLVDLLTNSHDEMDMRTARNVLWSLCDLKIVPLNVEPLVQQTINVLAETLGQCRFQEVEDLLRKLVEKITKRQLHFYNEQFMDSCVNYVIQNDCGFIEGIWILRKLSRIGHTSVRLIDYLGQKVALDPTSLTSCKPNALFSLVTGMANADYKPAEWELIRDSVLGNAILEKGQVELPWLKFAVDLAALGCFSTTLLQRIYQEDFLKQYLAREYNLLDHLQLLMLHQAVATLFPEYDGPPPPQHIIDKAIATNGQQVQEFPLKGALERGFGGPAYVRTNVYTKLGHFIHHMIVLRKGGYPVAINPTPEKDLASRTYIEDLDVPVDSQIVLVLGFHPGCYSINSSRLRGSHCLLVRSLESMGYSVVPVSCRSWAALLDQEKIPYLMQNIKIKCEAQPHEAALQQ